MPDQAKVADRKCIILLFDGTWNDSEFRGNDTNIVRLREIINATLQDERTQRARGGPPDPHVYAKTLVYYRRGVGTDGMRDSLLGGAFGIGVSDNVRRGYRFLAQHYAPHDDVFVFGFSRGAFTARSLVGYLGAAGLLRDAWCSPERERDAWAYYRTAPDDRLPGKWHALTPYVHPRDAFRIRALCVFDTVGALGVPTTWLKAANRRRYQFHNVELPSITEFNLHAIAIDEMRRPFEATIWRRHKFKPEPGNQATEQVWFPGVHADIGGGHLPGESRTPGLQALDDIPLDWMLRRLRGRYRSFPAPDGLSMAPGEALRRAAPHRSRTSTYRIWPPAHRAIANRGVAGLAPPRSLDVLLRVPGLVSRDRHQALAGEMVHISAIERLGACMSDGAIYAPRALAEALPDLAITYRPGAKAADRETLRIVGWDGTPIAPDGEHAATARVAIAAARNRLDQA